MRWSDFPLVRPSVSVPEALISVLLLLHVQLQPVSALMQFLMYISGQLIHVGIAQSPGWATIPQIGLGIQLAVLSGRSSFNSTRAMLLSVCSTFATATDAHSCVTPVMLCLQQHLWGNYILPALFIICLQLMSYNIKNLCCNIHSLFSYLLFTFLKLNNSKIQVEMINIKLLLYGPFE